MVKDDALSNAERYIVEIIRSVPLWTGIPFTGLRSRRPMENGVNPGSNPGGSIALAMKPTALRISVRSAGGSIFVCRSEKAHSQRLGASQQEQIKD